MKLTGTFEKIPCVIYSGGKMIAEYASQEDATRDLKLERSVISSSVRRGRRFSIIHNGVKVKAVARYKHEKVETI